jgi:hypothetical protein
MSLLLSPVYTLTCCNSVFFNLGFAWWGAPLPPLSRGACYTLAAIGSLPLSKPTGGGCATPAFSSQLVYLQFAWGSNPPTPGGAFHRTATATSFLLSKIAGRVLPLLPSPASLFIYSSVNECPSPTLQSSGYHTLFAKYLFFFSCLFIIQFSFVLFFPWVVVGLSRRLC